MHWGDAGQYKKGPEWKVIGLTPFSFYSSPLPLQLSPPPSRSMSTMASTATLARWQNIQLVILSFDTFVLFALNLSFSIPFLYFEGINVNKMANGVNWNDNFVKGVASR